MNWSSERFLRKTYEKWKTYERLGQHTNKLEFRFFLGRQMKEVEDIRMNWRSERFLRKTYERSGRYTKDLDNIRMNWSSERFFRKTYEGSGRHTNELEGSAEGLLGYLGYWPL